ncbi:MAG: ABC transporter substrate-binding protein [Chromatiales bacterium]|jgi:peptide/nickel transport system substrate-binding protein|nr:ABC transporter substrate-binding protein [Chromatiales bacterium]
MTKKPTREELGLNDIDPSDKQRIINAVSNGISRRNMLTMLGAVGIGAASGANLFSSAGAAYAATPKKGGSVRFASDLHGPSDTLDPQLFTSTIDYSRGRAIYSSLTQFRDSIVPEGELAEEFSANKAVTEWTFKLKKGVKFHDGSPMTADDVIWSMNRHTMDGSKSKAKTLVAGVKEWKKVDSHTVRAVMDAPNADLPAILATFHFKILKKGTTDFQMPVGTGPYRLKEFKPGVRSVQVRNDDYWRDAANFDEIEIFAITDSVARTNALLSGDIDLLQALDPKAIKQIERHPGAQVSSVPSGAYMGICCMLNSSPGNNKDFVMAMKHLPRRKRMVKSILKNQGTVGNDHPINVAYGPDFCGELPVREYDPDKAKFHLKKSGISSAQLHVAEVAPGVTDMSLMVQRDAQKIGLDLQIKKVPNDGYWGAVWMKAPLNVVTWNMRPTANVMLTLAFAPDAPWNDTFWKDERFGKVLKEVRGVTDPVKRHEMYCDLQKTASDGSGMVIPMHRNYVDAVKTGISGIPNVPLGALGGAEWPEFAWKA